MCRTMPGSRRADGASGKRMVTPSDLSGGAGTAAAKVTALAAAGVTVAESPSQVPSLIKDALSA